MNKQFGLTLVELMVTLAVLGVLMGIAAPSFVQLIASSNLTSQMNSFYADTRYARGEAVKRGVDVSLCPSSTSMDADPTCSGSDWKVGWIVFIDTNGNGARSTTASDGEAILRRQEQLTGSNSVQGSTAVSSIRYNSDGRVAGGAANLVFTAPNSATADRTVCISMTGKVRVLDKGSSTC